VIGVSIDGWCHPIRNGNSIGVGMDHSDIGSWVVERANVVIYRLGSWKSCTRTSVPPTLLVAEFVFVVEESASSRRCDGIVLLQLLSCLTFPENKEDKDKKQQQCDDANSCEDSDDCSSV